MKKEEFIMRYGEAAYGRQLEYVRNYGRIGGLGHERMLIYKRNYNKKGGPGYNYVRKYQLTGVPHERNLVRAAHRRCYQKYKNLIAFGSAIHHEWIPGTANYRGVALVDAEKHHHGIIDVIQILEGEITLLPGV